MSARALAPVILLAPLALAATPLPFDWALAQFQLPSGERDFSLVIRILGETSADRTPVALVTAVRGDLVDFAFDGAGGATSYVALGGTAGTARIEVMPVGERRVDVGVALSGRTAAGASAPVHALLLAPGVEGRTWHVTASAGSKELPARVTTGRGATVVSTEDLATGAMASVSDLSAGSGLATRSEAMDIVGALTFSCAFGPCSSSWTDPTGASGTFETDGYGGSRTGDGIDAFAGPPGRWTWSWQGAQYGDAVAIYAPLGRAAAPFEAVTLHD